MYSYVTCVIYTRVDIHLHVFINIGVSSGMLPTKGITLPFISFGGTNLLLMFALIALVLRINFEIYSYLLKNMITHITLEEECIIWIVKNLMPLKKKEITISCVFYSDFTFTEKAIKLKQRF